MSVYEYVCMEEYDIMTMPSSDYLSTWHYMYVQTRFPRK